MKYKTALFCENDKYAVTSYCAIHGTDPSLNIGDITLADENEVPDFNWMFGGSPCTDFSTAGYMKGATWTCRACGHEYNPLEQAYDKRDVCPKCGSSDLDKTRSSLLVEWLRFLRAKMPKVAMFENVKYLTGKKFRPTFEMFLNEVESYGYNTYWSVMNAKDYGVPQFRERVICVFIRKDVDNGTFEMPPPRKN